ncbi:hypothetical protein CEXT_12951 [Caerostris extrusa]|uniref:Uncharacterized protein n=1 Tax=Caerostris extrusa TaxID=172846 RepID=A0AAV4VBU7_CAEEX|nr:hypothetical protein CEXT_12951 [Caerostris extrusa]
MEKSFPDKIGDGEGKGLRGQEKGVEADGKQYCRWTALTSNAGVILGNVTLAISHCLPFSWGLYALCEAVGLCASPLVNSSPDLKRPPRHSDGALNLYWPKLPARHSASRGSLFHGYNILICYFYR